MKELTEAEVLKLPNREDVRLVKRCREGDAGAFEVLIRKYQDSVYSIAYRMVGDREEARDLAQETFVKAFEGIDSFNIRMSFRSWLYRIGTNTSIDYLRRRGRSRTISVNADDAPRHGLVTELPGPEAEIPENVSVSNETAGIVREAIESLPDNYKAVVVLYHMEGMSYKEIGKMLGVPKNTAKIWAYRARRMLCESLEGVV